jgi:hypothetical protein
MLDCNYDIVCQVQEKKDIYVTELYSMILNHTIYEDPKRYHYLIGRIDAYDDVIYLLKD